ncbi:uncharacterized protein VTP21DRAFT_2550 [Calcarisporiella thermophila]|uniref:uncharacterized protein n=1 Tax=Calcarisporiella thermophila TaxID=911321 RepID=UPI003743619C
MSFRRLFTFQAIAMAKYEVHYFPVHGLGELPRLMLEYAKADYENVFIEDWRKPGATQWLNEIKDKTPLGHIPVLVKKENGEEFVLAESGAINRYLARDLNLMGNPSDAKETAYIDMVNDAWHSFWPTYLNFHRVARNPGTNSHVDTFFNNVLPKHLPFLERLLDNKGSYLGQQRITIADLHAYVWMHRIINICRRNDIFEKFAPNHLKMYERLAEEPQIKEYYKPGGKFESIFSY